MVIDHDGQPVGDTLFLLVTCDLDPKRSAITTVVTRRLRSELEKVGRTGSLLTFDNGSKFKSHLAELPKGSVLYEVEKNIGYWSAIYWVLNSYENIFGRRYPYIYIIESDLLQYDLHRITDCENWMAEHSDIGSIRCQEYRVALRWLYDKKFGWLPFTRKHSLVAHYNGATMEPIRFGERDHQRRIVVSNFHAKLPALNRMAWMKSVFEHLADLEQVTEHEFMKQYQMRYQKTGVLDGGIFRSLGNDPDADFLTGSYTDPEKMKKYGYFSTRIDQIIKSDFFVSECRVE